MTDTYPFLDLFYLLRDAGLELGIPEYHLLLRAFSLGYGVHDEQDLRQVCQALWVKSRQQQQVFDFHFDQYMTTRRQRLEAHKLEAEQQAARQAPARRALARQAGDASGRG